MGSYDDRTEQGQLIKPLVDIAVESWRFGKLFDRLLLTLDAGQQSRYKGQYRWFQKQLERSLEEAGMKVVNVEGHAFDPGIAATPINIEEFGADDALMVDQMLEPIIMGPQGIVRAGTVILRKVTK